MAKAYWSRSGADVRVNTALGLLMAVLVASAMLPASPLCAQDMTTPGPSRNSHSKDALAGIKSSRLTLGQTIERAEKEVGGRAVEATFTPFATGGGSHEIVVMRGDGTMARVQIDGNAGSLVGVTNETITSALTSLTPEALNKTPRSLLDVVRAADEEEPDRRRVIAAAAEQPDGRVSYDVTFATADGDETRSLNDAGRPAAD